MNKNLKLEIYQSTWAMERRHPVLPEWSLEAQCKMIAEAGFHGFNIDLSTSALPSMAELKSSLTHAGLGCSICAFPRSMDDVKKSIEDCLFIDASALILNARIFPFTPEEAVEFVSESIRSGKESGVPIQFETHRFTLTNDLLFTCQLLDLCPELELVADLSHYVVGREMPMPVDDFHQQLIAKILSRSVSIQGRIASREQVQVPLHFPQHRAWREQFYRWWQAGVGDFKARAEAGSVFNFTCELGPPDYAITDENGYELSDRWQEGLILKDKFKAIWNASSSHPEYSEKFPK